MTQPHPELSDTALLQHYVHTHDQLAFQTLAARHLQWIYSAALRQTKSSALAEDITQGVLLTLSQKAPKLLHHPSLTSWLFRATRYGALALLRAEARRKRHEESAMPTQSSQPDPTWSDLSPHIDSALARLPESDRRILLLRFYQQLTHTGVAATLNITEEASRKRTDRALEKLRSLLKVSSPTLLPTLLSAKLLLPLPPTLVATVPATTASTLTVTKGIHAMLLLQKIKLAAAALLLLAIPTTITTVIITAKSKATAAGPSPILADPAIPTPFIQLVPRSAVHTVLEQDYNVPVDPAQPPVLLATTITDADHGRLTHSIMPLKYSSYDLDDGKRNYSWQEGSSKVLDQKSPFPKKTPEQFINPLGRGVGSTPHPELDKYDGGQKLSCYAPTLNTAFASKSSLIPIIFYWVDSQHLVRQYTTDAFSKEEEKIISRVRMDYTYNPTLPPNTWNLPDNADIIDGDPTLAQRFPSNRAYATTQSDDRIFSVHSYFVEPNGNTYIMCSLQPTEDLRASVGKNLAAIPSDLIPRFEPLPDYSIVPFAAFRGKGIQVYYLVLVAKVPKPKPPTLTITFPTFAPTGALEDESITLPPKHPPQTGVTLDGMIKDAFSVANLFKDDAETKLIIGSTSPDGHPTTTSAPFTQWTESSLKENLKSRITPTQ